MWRRSASTAATRTSAEMRDVWRQLRQRSLIANRRGHDARRSDSAVICGENDRDARFVTAECDTRAAVAARAGSSIESCRGEQLSLRSSTAEATEGIEDAGRLGAELPAADIALAAADEIENEHLRCGSSTQYPRSSEQQTMNANIGTTVFTRNRCARRSFES